MPDPDPTDEPSISAMIKPEECIERLVGDIDGDCALSPYEMCLLGNNSQEICDCVNEGGNLDDCIVEKHCDNLNDKLDPTKANIVPKLENLKTLVNENGEVGVHFKKNNGTYTNPDIPATNTPTIPIVAGGDTYGAAHTHPFFSGYPMFSWGDVYVLANLHNRAALDVKTEVTYMLVAKETNISAQASVYALVIDDIAALNAALTNDLFDIVTAPNSKLNFSSPLHKRTKALMDAQKLTYGGDNEAEFLKKFSNYGIKLFKANEDLSNWSELEYNHSLGTVFENPCN